jgi:hypothetical protein
MERRREQAMSVGDGTDEAFTKILSLVRERRGERHQGSRVDQS